MTKQDKRYMAFEDEDPMPFGKHRGERLVDVPARYLVYLWQNGLQEEYGRANVWREGLPKWLEDKIKLANYIWNCKEDLSDETGELM